MGYIRGILKYIGIYRDNGIGLYSSILGYLGIKDLGFLGIMDLGYTGAYSDTGKENGRNSLGFQSFWLLHHSR